ncbi:hypothetical protein ACFP67_13960 [Mammaliicoccus sciuri]|nr:hypothetical protein [Mammaliicoccus sciuri]
MKISYNNGDFYAVAENEFEKELLLKNGDYITKYLKNIYNKEKYPTNKG